MRKNIVLIGMMGSGKSTVGRLLAQQADRELADTDALIEQRTGRSIPGLFAREGEAAFRALELELCRELSRREGLVIACGGGLPTQDEAIAALKENGLVFWLNRDPGKTYDSLDVSGRPLAQGGREDFLRRYEERSPVYRRWADGVALCDGGPEAAAKLIIAAYLEVCPL